MIEPGGLTSEGAGQPGLSGAGLPGDDEVFMRLQPGALGQRQRIVPVEPAMRGEVDVSMQASTKRSLATARRLVRRLSARMAASRSSIRPSHSSRLRSSALLWSARSR